MYITRTVVHGLNTHRNLLRIVPCSLYLNILKFYLHFQIGFKDQYYQDNCTINSAIASTLMEYEDILYHILIIYIKVFYDKCLPLYLITNKV